MEIEILAEKKGIIKSFLVEEGDLGSRRSALSQYRNKLEIASLGLQRSSYFISRNISMQFIRKAALPKLLKYNKYQR